MPLKAPTFTCGNIIAILDSATQGGTIEDVLKRASVDVSAASLSKWIKDGNADLRKDLHTAYRLFAEQWNTIYPGPPPRHEAARMLEITKAFEKMGISLEPPNLTRLPSTESRPRKSNKVCECGNAKNPADRCCTTCTSMDSVRSPQEAVA